ncbi:MAG: TRASH domain-containing protein [Verrucomicrobiota bacterium]
MKTIFATLLISIMPLGLSLKAADTAPYPLTTCVVSGEKLGTMGKPYVYNHEGREVQFCCKSCVKDFNKNPKQFLAKLDEAAGKAK